jgi:hypothetical protein
LINGYSAPLDFWDSILLEKLASNQTESTSERLQRFLPLLFPDKWHHDNPDLIQALPKSTELSPISTLNLQTEAITKWTGTCNRLGV